MQLTITRKKKRKQTKMNQYNQARKTALENNINRIEQSLESELNITLTELKRDIEPIKESLPFNIQVSLLRGIKDKLDRFFQTNSRCRADIRSDLRLIEFLNEMSKDESVENKKVEVK
jgi:hypothetical protein